MSSLKKAIEAILPLVAKPGRYLGNEPNAIRKDPGTVEVQVALAFPDLYDIGESYVGFGILYHLINRRDDALAERVFAPWMDMETQLRERGIPLFSLETARPLTQFDIVGFTLHYELTYTNILNMLDLAGIPLRSADRSEEMPLILAGGPCAYNPEPLSPFIDAFFVGDGEEAIGEIIEAVKQSRGKNRTRGETLRALAELEGVYVPAFYEASYASDGAFTGIAPIVEGVAPVVQARILQTLSPEHYPEKPIVPLIDVSHDHLSIEIMRGCSRGCRFCSAGMMYRPVRERPVSEITAQAEASLAATGLDGLSLLSLSTSDYSDVATLVDKLNDRFAAQRVAISLPSLRPDAFSVGLAEAVSRVRKSGLTFAPEAGTQRLRDVINKNVTEDDLLGAAKIAYEKGWNLIKLYFMIGLPTETYEDLDGIVDLVGKVARIARGNGGKSLNVSISPFSPKPNTPFQWDPQDTLSSLGDKCRYLSKHISRKSVHLRWRDPEVTGIETLLARGDRRIGRVLYRAWEKGAKFDEWSEHFNFERWTSALDESGIALEDELGPRRIGHALPWEIIQSGIRSDFLLREREKAARAEVTPDCRTGDCSGCGIRDLGFDRKFVKEHSTAENAEDAEKQKIRERSTTSAPSAVKSGEGPTAPTESRYGRRQKKRRGAPAPSIAGTKVRLQYAKEAQMRFIGHLDVTRAFERAIRQAQIPIAYSQGFHPHPKASFGPPLALGIESLAEYVDLQLSEPYPWDIVASLNSILPPGLRIVDAKPIFGKTLALNAAINAAAYDVSLPPEVELTKAVESLLAASSVILRRTTKQGIKDVDIRPGIRELRSGSGVLSMTLTLGQQTSPRPMELLKHLLGWPSDRMCALKITRTGLYIERNGRKLSPMQVL
ncbi:MAG: TIGR03960 family B12-binding radical SAM protein [Candidatus Latescibacteria bacterium]|nr:TIGR03960 family B12-binding radical SAM protein [Candidatus Latescibacterota bacterium]